MSGTVNEKSIIMLGIYHEEFISGIKYRIYDLVIDKEGDIRFRNYRDLSNISNKDNVLPSIIELKGKDIGKHVGEEYYQSDFGRNVYWYNESMASNNLLYRPIELKESEVLVRYVLKDDIESSFYNCVKNDKGHLVSYNLTDDDMILLSGVGLEKIVYSIGKYLEKIKSVM